MLYVSLVFSGILWLIALVAARRHPHDVRWGLFAVGGGLVMFTCAIMASVANFAFFISLVVSLIAWPRVRPRIRHYFPLSLLAFVLAYGFAGYLGYQHHRDLDRYRAEYAYESMEDRLPEPAPSAPLSPTMDERLAHFEIALGKESSGWRKQSLHELHEDSVKSFVNSPGFGVIRMPMSPSYGLKTWKSEESEPRMQDSSSPKPLVLSATDETDLQGLHEARVLDFVNAMGFGFVKDRKNVAGFLPHGFSKERQVETKIEASRIELIGLLLHPKPRVYLSERLPVMEEVRTGKTRELDSFETSALQQIREGADLVPGGPGNEARLVGAIRSGKQCVECHGGKRGDLLGAFSYSLRRVEAKK